MTMSETPPALEVSGVSYSYKNKQALSDISFKISKGEFKMLLGPNGAGKTTLFSLLTRLYRTNTGSIHINGRDLNRRPGVALAKIGVVFQQPTLDLDLSVKQNLLYHTALHGISSRTAKKLIKTELERLDMADRQDDTVRSLNGGHRRRVEIARALLHSPDILLLDEPTVGLDVATRRGIVDHVHALCKSRGIAVLWATHLIDELCDGDQVIILHHGKIQADGDSKAINASINSANMNDTFNQLTSKQETLIKEGVN